MEPELANLPSPFLQAIRDRPDDDAARLIAADFLDENGNPEYAEYIRISCELDRYMVEPVVKGVRWDNPSTPLADLNRVQKGMRRGDLMAFEAKFLAGSPLLWVGWQANSTWVPSFDWDWNRGFVKTVRCTLVDWYGGVCEGCYNSNERTPAGHGNWLRDDCKPCHGTGKVGGHGPEILRSQPVTEVATEKRPRGVSDRFYWWDYGRWPGTNIENEDVPEDVFALLEDFLHDDSADVGCRIYPSEEAAMTALSAALIAWALTQADKVS